MSARSSSRHVDTRPVKERFIDILVEQLGIDESEAEDTAILRTDLGMDSLDDVEIMMACEEAFDIEIPDSDVLRIQTVEDAVQYLEKRLKEKKK